MPVTPNGRFKSDELVSKLWLHGMILTGVFYGIVVALSFSCIQLLLPGPSESSQVRWNRRSRLLIYVVVLFILATISMGFSSKEVEVAYVYHLDYPGGPAFFILHDTSISIAGGAVCFVLLQWAVDGLLIWRCFAFFSIPPSHMGWVKFITALIIIGNVGLSCIFVICVSGPALIGPRIAATAVVLTYGLYTMLLNMGITGAIAAKVLQYRRFLIRTLGPAHGAKYIGIVSILVESAAIIVAYDLFFLIPAVIGHPLANIGRQIGTMIQLIPPLMIIQRVARNTAISVQPNAHPENLVSGALSQLEFAAQSGESRVDEIKSPHTQ